MAGENTTATAEGWAKVRYGEKKDARPKGTKFQNRIPFEARKRTGRYLSEPVFLSDEAGVTFNRGVTGNAFGLNAAGAAESEETQANGAEIVVSVTTGLKVLTTAIEAGEQAFGNFYEKMLSNGMRAAAKYVELTSLHGGENMGVVSSNSGAGGAYAIVLTEASWLSGAWIGSKNAMVDFYTSNLVTKRNLTTDVVITSVNVATRTINVTGLDAELAAVIGTDVVYFKGMLNQVCDGVGKVCGLTTGESFVGINHNDRPDLWSGNTQDCSSGPLEFSDLNAGLMKAAEKGGEGDYLLMCAMLTWGSLADDVAALRSIDQGYSRERQDIGTQGIRYFTHTGTVEVFPTVYQKNGRAFAFPESEFMRIGSTDITGELPGIGQKYFNVLSDQNGFEIRLYSDQLPYTTDVKSCVDFINITN